MRIEEDMRNSHRKRSILERVSLSALFFALFISTAVIISVTTILMFARVYEEDIKNNAVTSTEQAVVQVKNTVKNYTEEIRSLMEMIQKAIGQDESAEVLFEQLFKVRSDVVAAMVYDMEGNLKKCWSNGHEIKENYQKNLSYVSDFSMRGQPEEEQWLHITAPHVESIFELYHPWVVTFSKYVIGPDGEQVQMAVDIRFENIADYVDEVGIGQHGYCYIANSRGKIVYHPQQQLIYYGLKEEIYKNKKDGNYIDGGAIYTIQSLENCDWRIVGISYVDDIISAKLESSINRLVTVLLIVLTVAFVVALLLSLYFSGSAKKLMNAMQEFEGNAENYQFQKIRGTREVTTLSESFENMAHRIQRLIEKVRQEEVSLRKTELKALQAQINPHFLYNTLDAISWMCEEGDTQKAKEMVNALANLFRISISKGHELITIEKEIEHAQNYLKIQNFRYQDQFTYEFVVEQECLPYFCNKITLQPMIENAIYHGLNRMVDEGMIKITIASRGDDVIFMVEDNGVGMTEQQCFEILHGESDDKRGIGIKNVDDRIKIYFGEKYGVQIMSEPDEGTCVLISMPKVEKNSYDEK